MIRDREFYKTILRISLPAAFQSLVSFLVVVADDVMVSKLPNAVAAQAAVSQVNSITAFYTATLTGLVSGSSVLISQYWGKKDMARIRRIFSVVLWFCALVSLIFVALARLIPEPIIHLVIGAGEADVVTLALEYFSIACWTYIPFAITTSLIGMLRSIEVVRITLVTTVMTLFINVGLNYVLIFGKLGLPALGITGAAVATLLSRVVEFVVAFSYAFRCRTMPLMKHAILRPGMDMLRKFLRYSAPVLINETLWGTGFSMITVIMGHMANSSDLIAAYTLAGNIDKLMTSGVFGIAAAVSVIVGKEIGTGNLKGVYNIGRALCFTAFAFGIVLGIAEYTMFVTLMRPFVMPLFSLSAVAERLCSVMLMCYACAIPLHSFSTTMVVGVLRGGGDVHASLFIDNFPLWCGTLPMMCLLGLVLKVPNEVFCLCLMIEYIIKSPLGLYRLHSGKWIHDITRIDE